MSKLKITGLANALQNFEMRLDEINQKSKIHHQVIIHYNPKFMNSIQPASYTLIISNFNNSKPMEGPNLEEMLEEALTNLERRHLTKESEVKSDDRRS